MLQLLLVKQKVTGKQGKTTTPIATLLQTLLVRRKAKGKDKKNDDSDIDSDANVVGKAEGKGKRKGEPTKESSIGAKAKSASGLENAKAPPKAKRISKAKSAPPLKATATLRNMFRSKEAIDAPHPDASETQFEDTQVAIDFKTVREAIGEQQLVAGAARAISKL